MKRKVGAELLETGDCRFTVWSPFVDSLQVIFENENEAVALEKDEKGYFEKVIPNIPVGTKYKFQINENESFPDPASRSQPEGVHGWSEVVENKFDWKDESWKGIPLSEMIIYELHVGTFTEAGTFDAIIQKLDYLQELGINCIEIMPIAQFPGDRNWGYDGVYPFAVQKSYGGTKNLKKLIDVCHSQGIAVILDAVYNHMGPEGNYLSQFGPYFTNKYKTPWGQAINFDDEYSDEVRNFFLQNALMWLEEFHFDGLRLDAIHEIIDRGANHFLKELSRHVDFLEEKTGKKYTLIAESDLNDVKIINGYQKGGFGLEAQWVDDFHHSVHTLLTGEKGGYYLDYGDLDRLAKAYKQAFVYDGEFSKFRKRTVGNSPKANEASQFVVCIQNHDQVGNRMLGERLSQLVNFEKQKLAAGILLTSSFVPMLFMGEEFAEDNPFQYFVSHGDPDLVKAVQEGRKNEFKYFFDHEGDFPDPQSEQTFQNSKINWNFKENEQKSLMFNYYKELISLRKEGTFSVFKNQKMKVETDEDKELLIVSADAEKMLFIAFNFSNALQKVEIPQKKGNFRIVLASAAKKWGGNHDFLEKIDTQIDLPANSLIICETVGK